MKENDSRKPKRPFVYDAKGDLTNMVYDDSGRGVDLDSFPDMEAIAAYDKAIESGETTLSYIGWKAERRKAYGA